MTQTAYMLTRQVLWDGLRYCLAGGFRLKHSHIPSEGHTIDADFMGICVATAADPAVDDYVIAQLQALGIRRVRLDISDDDAAPAQQRFAQRLLDAGFLLTLHAVQPLQAARQMYLPQVQQQWQDWLAPWLQQFGPRLQALEIGNTINRKKWCGYDRAGFLQAWHIAYTLAKRHGVTVVGPNVQDFEPLFNISLLKVMRARAQLPDMHSNNLFVERVVEPEQADYRIFKYRWTRHFNFNLLKKARLLQKIGADFGVPTLVSSVAFWAIYRIQRRLPAGAEKQADYVTRYFTLLAAAGAVHQANWGAMICHREGLIDDGLQDAEYPLLERVAYYKSADGQWHDYRYRPSFAAFKTAAYWLNGAQYLGAIASGKGLEIHRLRQHDKLVHLAWTINGRCVPLAEIYAASSVREMTCLHRDGQAMACPLLITEVPVYLQWPSTAIVELQVSTPALSQTVIHAHVQGQQYFPVHEGPWRGMLLADNAAQAALLWQQLHPDRLAPKAKTDTLRHARNAIWSMPDPRDETQKVTVKQPVKMYLHKAYLDRYKPSKAKRSWNGAMELMRRGIGTARPLAYFEREGDLSLKQNFYVCEFVPHDFAISQAFLAFRQGETSHQGIAADTLYQAFARFCVHMHNSGIYFRDFSGGNILVQHDQGELQFVLIDTARLRATATAATVKQRMADLNRALHKLHWAGRKQFLRSYLAMYGGRGIDWQWTLSFYLYDCKVALKRTIGRKGIKTLLRNIKRWRGS